MRALFLLLTGCLVGTHHTNTYEDPICVTGTPAIDVPMFEQLTANRWGSCGSNNGLCLELHGDGTYSTIAGFDDYFITDEGTWNFVARDTTSGLACLDNGSVIDFALMPSGLAWDGGVLPPLTAQPALGARDQLPEIPASELFVGLTEHGWTKTNEFDLYSDPTSFTLRRDGTFDATFRNGACSASGTFSVVHETWGTELHPNVQPNTCDTRSGGTTANIGSSNESPNLKDGLLRFYHASYRDSAVSTSERRFEFSAYGGSPAVGLVVGASWQGALAANATMTWAMSLANDTTRTQTISALQISMTPLVVNFDSYSYAGPAISLVDRTLVETVDHDASYRTDADIALPGPGLYSLDVDATSQDDVQSYRNLHNFIVEMN